MSFPRRRESSNFVGAQFIAPYCGRDESRPYIKYKELSSTMAEKIPMTKNGYEKLQQ